MAGKVLIVDDDASVQRMLQFNLQQEGYEVLIASDGTDALRQWQQEAPSLILLDSTIAGLDGYEVATRIRAEESGGRHVPIIMLTNDKDVQGKVRALRAGADDYLIKPFHPAELIARMKSLIARFAPNETLVGRPPMGRVHAYYGAKGGVGTTTIAINAAIALKEIGRRVCPGRRQPPVRRPPGVPRPRPRPQEHRRPRQRPRDGRRPRAEHRPAARLRGGPAAGAAVAGGGRPRDRRAPPPDPRAAVGHVRLRDRRHRQAPRGPEPDGPRRGRHDLRGDDRRPVVPQERPAPARDDRPPGLRAGQAQARPQPLERVHRASASRAPRARCAARSSTRS